MELCVSKLSRHVNPSILQSFAATQTRRLADLTTFPGVSTAVQAALNQLGYKCWHSTTCFGDVRQCRRWVAAQDAKFLSQGPAFARADWDDVFQGYTAVSADPPAVGFAAELIDAYPDAKVLLVERDEDAWFASMDATVMDHMFRWDLNFVSDLDPQLIGPVRDMQKHWVRSWWRVSSKDEMRAKARDMYREHNKMVRARTPPHRLLEYRLEDGWAPLCEFLGKDVPATPFPVRNDRSQVKTRNAFIRSRGLKLVGFKAAKIFSALLAGGLVWWIVGRRTSLLTTARQSTAGMLEHLRRAFVR